MKKIVSLIVALVLCIGVACPVFAAAESFVPSISYKEAPEVDHADVHPECLVVTSIAQAEEKSTDIHQDERDLLLDTYKALQDGTMKSPADAGYVIRDLVDVSWEYTGCVTTQHGKEEWIAEEDTFVTVTFDLGVSKTEEVIVKVLVDGEWVPARSVKNNRDGTITVELDYLGVVAFMVKDNGEAITPDTGDTMGRNLMLFAGLMAVSAGALVTLVVIRRRRTK